MMYRGSLLYCLQLIIVQLCINVPVTNYEESLQRIFRHIYSFF